MICTGPPMASTTESSRATPPRSVEHPGLGCRPGA
jgi:hypothetical protein